MGKYWYWYYEHILILRVFWGKPLKRRIDMTIPCIQHDPTLINNYCKLCKWHLHHWIYGAHFSLIFGLCFGSSTASVKPKPATNGHQRIKQLSAQGIPWQPPASVATSLVAVRQLSGLCLLPFCTCFASCLGSYVCQWHWHALLLLCTFDIFWTAKFNLLLDNGGTPESICRYIFLQGKPRRGVSPCLPHSFEHTFPRWPSSVGCKRPVALLAPLAPQPMLWVVQNGVWRYLRKFVSDKCRYQPSKKHATKTGVATEALSLMWSCWQHCISL